MSNLQERLRKVIGLTGNPKEDRGKIAQFCRETGFKSGNVSHWLNDSIHKRPSVDSLAKICTTYNINANWLLNDKQPQYTYESSNAEELKNEVRKLRAEIKKMEKQTRERVLRELLAEEKKKAKDS